MLEKIFTSRTRSKIITSLHVEPPRRYVRYRNHQSLMKEDLRLLDDIKISKKLFKQPLYQNELLEMVY